MKTAIEKPVSVVDHGQSPDCEGRVVHVNGHTAYVRRHGGTPDESRAACERAIVRMNADKRKGDVVKFLKEFRSNPRG
jgi:hypothetical protein